jgi:hypothetical protein
VFFFLSKNVLLLHLGCRVYRWADAPRTVGQDGILGQAATISYHEKRKRLALCALAYDGGRRGAELIFSSCQCWASSFRYPLTRLAFPFAHILDGILAHSESRVRHGALLGETAAAALQPHFLAPKRCIWSELAFRSKDGGRRDDTRQKRLELLHPFPRLRSFVPTPAPLVVKVKRGSVREREDRALCRVLVHADGAQSLPVESRQHRVHVGNQPQFFGLV